MLVSLLRLQALAFWRAPHRAGRLALAALKVAGAVYAIGAAAILGVVWPDLVGAVAPDLDPLALVERWMLAALAALTGVRLLFQNVPTRGARAFLLLPVSRRRVAASVVARSLVSPFNAVPVVFVAPFAVRVVSPVAGVAGAWAWALSAVAIAALSHAALVLWKTRLGTRPAAVPVSVVGAALAVAGLDLAAGGLLADARLGASWIPAVLLALAAGGLGLAWSGVQAALSLDGPARAGRQRGGAAGFEHPGVRAFLDLDVRLVTRASYPRGLSVNAVLLSTGLAALAATGTADRSFDLMLMFSAGVAASFGQFAVPLASGYWDRLMTLPNAVPLFARAKWLGIVLATVALGVLQLAVVLALRPSAAWLIGVSVLFSAGVLAPAALWGSTWAPKPIDLSGRVAFNYKVQSFGGQATVAGTAAVAIGLVTLAGPRWGFVAAAALGVVGILASPVWLPRLAARIVRQRHAVGARFRATL